MRGFISFALLGVACLGLLAGCVRFESKRGVEVAWQPAVVQDFRRGETTRAEVLEVLGPPSQIISLEEETVLYYLFENRKGNGAILILFNRIDLQTNYERAVFFFGKDDLLTDFSSRVHAHDGV